MTGERRDALADVLYRKFLVRTNAELYAGAALAHISAVLSDPATVEAVARAITGLPPDAWDRLTETTRNTYRDRAGAGLGIAMYAIGIEP